MSDISAQAFRELAAIAAKGRSLLARRYEELLLAAAEQREQLEAMRQLNEADNRTQAAYHAQIATLTAERDEARQLLEQVRAWAKAFTGYAVTHNAVSGYFDKLWSILYVAEETPDAK